MSTADMKPGYRKLVRTLRESKETGKTHFADDDTLAALIALQSHEQEVAELVEAVNGIHRSMLVYCSADDLLRLSTALRPFTGDEK